MIIVVLLTSLVVPSCTLSIQRKTTLGNISLNTLREVIRANGNKLPPELIGEPKTALKHSGVQKVLVLLMKFKGLDPTLPYKLISENLENSRISPKNYFSTTSYGKLTVDYGKDGIHDWMYMPRPFFMYFSIDQLLVDAYATAQSNGIDFSEYDEDGNSVPDLTLIVWPGDSNTVGGPMPGDFTYHAPDGEVIMVGEDTGARGFPTITIYHEFFHGLGGLYDLYDYSYTKNMVGGWDLMGEGGWNGYCGLSSFSRWKAGWLEIETITEPGVYDIHDLNGDGPHRAYKIPIPGVENEWLLVENRQKTGSDAFFEGCPNQGLVVYHIDERRKYASRFNTLNEEWRTPGVTIFDPGGSDDRIKPGAFYGQDVKRPQISSITTPSTLPYQKTIKETILISEISAIGPVMTFKLGYEKAKNALLQTLDTLSFGQVEWSEEMTKSLLFSNLGLSKVRLELRPMAQWIKLDRTSFIGNDEEIFVTIETAMLKFGVNKSLIAYAGNVPSGSVSIVVDVIPVKGDINADRAINEIDFEIFSKAFGSKNGDFIFDPKCDLNNDGQVDGSDLMIMAKRFKPKAK